MNTRVLGYFVRFASVGALFVTVSGYASAADKTARDLFPPSTVGYLEIPQPARLVRTVLDHPLAQEIENHPDFQKALVRREYQDLQGALKLLESKLGMKWQETIEPLTEGGIYLGFDLPTQGVAALVQTADDSLAKKLLDTIIEISRAESKAKGRENDLVALDELRGIAIYKIGNVELAAIGKWLLVTNKRLLLAMVLENYLGSGTSLNDDQQFQAVLKVRGPDPSAWLYVDLRMLRTLGVLRAALGKKSDNPAAELLVGGILGAIPDAPYVTASLKLESSRAVVTAALPGNPQTIAKTREFYFGAEGNGAAPPLLAPQQTLLALSSYRDFASLWRHAPDLFDERINARIAEAESKLNTFFGGKSFRDDILGNIEPGLQVVVARQQFPQSGITPAIKLPAGAAVIRMKKPEETMRNFKITFQSFIGFLNIAGGTNGLPPFDLNSERRGDALVISAEYVPPVKAETHSEAPLQYNASPTAIFVGDWMILSSARPLALDVLAELQRQPTTYQAVNSRVVVDGKVVQSVLADNRGPLIARNMLDKGHDRPAAEKEIDALLKALRYLDQSSIQLKANDRSLELDVELVLTTAK
jgi:hypothetical protein